MPMSWMFNEQTRVAQSSAEVDVGSLNAGLGMKVLECAFETLRR